MNQVLAFIGMTLAWAALCIVAWFIIAVLVSRIPRREKQSPDPEPARPIGQLLDADTTRRWMRFSAPDQPEDK